MRESLDEVVRKHRNIYHFGGSWARVLLAPVPWIGVLFVFLLLLFAHRRLSIAPGVPFDLPAGQTLAGGQSPRAELMIPVANDAPGGEETLVFFDDDRFSLLDPEQVDALSERLRAAGKTGGGLLLMADKRIPHGDVMRFVALARASGISKIDVGTKPEP